MRNDLDEKGSYEKESNEETASVILKDEDSDMDDDKHEMLEVDKQKE